MSGSKELELKSFQILEMHEYLEEVFGKHTEKLVSDL
jgi:hypothetical protein